MMFILPRNEVNTNYGSVMSSYRTGMTSDVLPMEAHKKTTTMYCRNHNTRFMKLTQLQVLRSLLLYKSLEKYSLSNKPFIILLEHINIVSNRLHS